MQQIYLLRPIDSGDYVSVRTSAIPVSGSRVIKSDDGVEIEEGFQRFIIPKRLIDTDWKVKWRDTFFRVEGVVPSNTPYKLVLVCSVEERLINVIEEKKHCSSIIDYKDPTHNISIFFSSKYYGSKTEVLYCEGING